MPRLHRPSAASLSRRRFLRRASGTAVAGLFWSAFDWDAVYARAGAAGIVPGTQVDAAGRPASFDAAAPFIGEIVVLPYTFAPRGWAFCDGQLLSISQNTALFSLLGTYYGGDGRTTFALPDFRGRGPLHFGQGPGLTERVLGESGGTSTVSLLVSEIPVHTHAGAGIGTGRRRLGTGDDVRPSVVSEENAYGTVDAGAMRYVDPAGGSQPHNNLPPYLTLNFCIALQGAFPPRN